MPKVVVVGGLLKCSHQGLVRITSGNSKLLVQGAAVVTGGQEMGYSFLPATAPPTPAQPAPCQKRNTDPATTPSPCTVTLAASTGVSSRIKVDGAGALLDTASGNATNALDPAATWEVSDPGQTLLGEA